jgi:V8-like Glu-specific endopeptidase
VCHLYINRRRGAYNSTGALIARTQLVTAAHNVYSPVYNRIRDGEVRCGRSGDAVVWAPQERFGRKDQNAARRYYWRRYSRDYARVHLPVSAPFPADFRLLKPDEAAPDSGDIVRVAGFPWTKDVSRGTMYETEGQILEVTRDFIYYDAHTRGGISGAPVWIERGGEFIVVGIHVAGTDSTPSFPARATARRINGEAFAAIREWMGADTAR